MTEEWRVAKHSWSPESRLSICRDPQPPSPLVLAPEAVRKQESDSNKSRKYVLVLEQLIIYYF